MKVVQINATCGVGSTGKICVGISQLLTQNNIENYILFCENNTEYPLGVKYTSKFYTKYQALKSRVNGNFGFTASLATKKLIKHLEKIKPDVVILHNLHSHGINLEILFKYFKKNSQIKLYWVFHDCWAFTGYCTHFAFSKCLKWQDGCKECKQHKEASWFFDNSQSLYNKKKKLFSSLNLEIITPSKWLKDLVEKSIFKDYKVTVINNGIDLDVFKPTPSSFRKEYNIPDNKFVILGVAFDWGVRKGLDVFVELSKKLDNDIYQIVLVGTNDKIDKQLPKNIITIHRTQNQQELAKIYTAVDLFVNPTREDTYPTVNMESLACGTPVLTFETGGSAEIIDKTSGRAVPCEDINVLVKEIVHIRGKAVFDEKDCLIRAKKFNFNERFAEYINLIMER